MADQRINYPKQLKNVPNPISLNTPDFNFTPQNPGGSLIIGSNIITLSPMPFGITPYNVGTIGGASSASGTYKHYLYITDGGNSEIVGITSVNMSTGAVGIVCTHTHSGNWSIQSATSGIQEALWYAMYLVLSTNPPSTFVPPVVRITPNTTTGNFWTCQGPIYFPPTQDWSILGENSAYLAFLSSIGSLACIFIDSYENSEYKIPFISSNGTGPILRICPTNIVPFDNFVITTDLLLTTSAMAKADITSPVVLFDMSNSAISNSEFSFGELNGGNTTFSVIGGGGPNVLSGCTIKHRWVHGGSVCLVSDNANCLRNIWELNLAADAHPNIPCLKIFGANQEFHLKSNTGTGVVVQSGAYGNLIYMPRGENIAVTNNSTFPNRIYTCDVVSMTNLKLGYTTTTPAFPGSGVQVFNNTLFNIIITFLTAGSSVLGFVYDWANISQVTGIQITQGMQILLQPGEAIAFTYASTAPTWKWRAISL